ncbi:MAG: UbiA family prenyltransferase [Methanomassiliicoccales archaeon]|nr:MAG: UbiA family prenyltransferase [Methanomassiliicoccales archaeon]
MPASAVRQWLKLARLQAGCATAITSVFGAILLMPRYGIDVVHLFILFIIGLLFHFYGFVLNEYSDIEVDMYAKELTDKPLIKGTIKKKHALYAAIVAIMIALGAEIIIFKSVLATSAFLVAIILGAIYDLYGKRFFGADFVLGGSIFFFTLFGAFTVSNNLTPVVFLAAFLFFIQLAFQTGFTGGMKDIPHDYLAGAKTSPVYLGCRVVGKKLIITREFRIYVIGTKTVHTSAVFIPFLVEWFDSYDPVILQIPILILLVLLMWGAALKAVSFKEFKREKLMRILGAHEVVTYPMVAILVMGFIGILNAVILLLLPIIWYAGFLYIIYGRFMPDV